MLSSHLAALASAVSSALLAASFVSAASPPAASASATGPTGPVSIAIDAGKILGPISPLVYGQNNIKIADYPYTPLVRQGGNRMTAYNWETNASNAGNDWHNQNDGFLGGGDTPGAVVKNYLTPAMQRGVSAIITVPMAGYVAADKKADGDVNKTPNYLETRFDKSYPKKKGAFVYPPDLTDHAVYQDEFVWWVNREFPESARHGARIFYDLDNEPDLWSNTHSRIHPKPLTYAELVQRTHDYASAIKAVDPDAVIFGFVSYGFNGFRSLQNAPDANGRDFIDFFLDSCRAMQAEEGKRLVDVLDLHWYPEARGGGKRITDRGNSPETVRARVEAPRSLWDPTYVEDSWITNDVLHGPIALIPQLKKQIAEHYPGTKLAFTEYDYGGGDHISGAVAEADVLGIFGEQGVFAATIWGGGPFIEAGFNCYTNFDGHGGHVGDQAVEATSGDVADVSVHAMRYAEDAGRMSVVLINRADAPRTCDLTVRGFDFASGKTYRVMGASPKIVPADAVNGKNGRASVTLPGLSVSVLILSK